MKHALPTTVLVTGGAGFIGSALVRRLVLEAGCEVVNVDKLTYAGSLEALAGARDHPRHHFHRVDVCDGEAVRALLDRYRPGVVLHLAAESHVDRSIAGPAPFVQTNIAGTHAVLEAVRAHWEALPAARRERFRLVHVSTDEVYGSTEEGAFTEDSPYRPSSPYSASKAAADHLARAWHRTYGLPVITVAGSNTYGPWQYPEKLVPLAVTRLAAGRPVPLYGDGRQVRQWLHVDDHVAGLLRAAERGVPGRHYNLGGPDELANLELVRRICRLLDARRPGHAPHEALVEPAPDRPGHDFRYALDSSRARDELGWTPAVALDDGLAATVDWYLARPPGARAPRAQPAPAAGNGG